MGVRFVIPEIGEFDSSRVYLSSDEHLGHTNIIQYTGRAYSTVEEMDADIIRRHNAMIPTKGSVWVCLGDFAFVRNTETERAIDQLRRYVKKMNGGVKILFRGNHDRLTMSEYYATGFDHVIPKGPGLTVMYEDQKIEMRHRPMLYPEMADYEALYRDRNPKYVDDRRPNYMILDRDNPMAEKIRAREGVSKITGDVICGHVHQTFRHYVKGNVLNVGVDVWDMSPIKLDDAVAILKPELHSKNV